MSFLFLPLASSVIALTLGYEVVNVCCFAYGDGSLGMKVGNRTPKTYENFSRYTVNLFNNLESIKVCSLKL